MRNGWFSLQIKQDSCVTFSKNKTIVLKSIEPEECSFRLCLGSKTWPSIVVWNSCCSENDCWISAVMASAAVPD